MRYKNKDIRSMYSVSFATYIVGLVFTLLALLLLVCGFVFAGKKLNNQMHLDDAMKLSGNHAVRVVYFDIVEEPIKAGDYKRDTFYLVTDGTEYRLAVLDDKDLSEIKNGLQKTVPYRAEGMTRFIIDDDTNEEIAAKASQVLGQKVTTDNMDDVLGDVCFTYFKLSYKSVLFDGYLVNLILGGLLLLVGGGMFAGARSDLKGSREVKSLSGITADDIDNEASNPDSVFMSRNLLISPNMVVGFTHGADKYKTGQVALKYDEIIRLYSYNKVIIPGGEMNAKNCYSVIEAEAIDGNKYVIYDSRNAYTVFDQDKEIEGILNKIHEMNPGIILEPAGAKYQTYRFSYVLKDEEEEKVVPPKDIDDELREEICDSLNTYTILTGFADTEAIFSLKMQFVDNNFVDIITGYFGDRESEVAPRFYEFLKKDLDKGWDDYIGEEYSLIFSAVGDRRE